MVTVHDIYDADEEQRQLALVLFPRYARMLLAVHHLTASAFPELGNFLLDDAATRRILAHAAQRVVLIDAATRAALQDVLAEGQARGYSARQMADGVLNEDYGGVAGLYLDTWKGRAETIARTELAEAQVTASLDRYAATGLVSKVQIVEHPNTDDACASRNGQIVPISERPGLLHPNCRMGLVPVVEPSPAAQEAAA